MDKLIEGQPQYVKGSGVKPYELKNVGGVYSCSCPAWLNAGGPIGKRTCKHLKKLLGEANELARIGAQPPQVNEVDATLARASITAPITAGSEDAARILDRAEAQGRKLRPDEKAKLSGPPVLLAHKFEGDLDPTGWFMSEKLDGVRAYWTGKEFLSRQGNVYHAPDWFKAGLPDHPLDGELWIGRKKFQQTISVVKRYDAGPGWKDVKYMVYDAPHLKLPFEERAQFVENLIQRKFGHIIALSHKPVASRQHLQDELRRVVAEGGEGLMIRKPGSLYEVGRSYTLLKVKQFEDGEAVVIGYSPGKGRHKGVVGALEVRDPEGREFSVGTGLSDAERKNPPPIGCTITYSFVDRTDAGVPKCGAFVRIRED